LSFFFKPEPESPLVVVEKEIAIERKNLDALGRGRQEENAIVEKKVVGIFEDSPEQPTAGGKPYPYCRRRTSLY
jgi:hypothetical protein